MCTLVEGVRDVDITIKVCYTGCDSYSAQVCRHPHKHSGASISPCLIHIRRLHPRALFVRGRCCCDLRFLTSFVCLGAMTDCVPVTVAVTCVIDIHLQSLSCRRQWHATTQPRPRIWDIARSHIAALTPLVNCRRRMVQPQMVRRMAHGALVRTLRASARWSLANLPFDLLSFSFLSYKPINPVDQASLGSMV